MSSSPPYYGSLDEVLALRPPYYGNRPAPSSEIFSTTTYLTSEEVKISLLAMSQPNPALHVALSTIFASPEWVSQSKPVDVKLLRVPPIRVKDFDQSGAEWWPCQLGCPEGIPVNGKGTKITQANRATEHIEWHLGLFRYVCPICMHTFLRSQDCKDHEKVHKAPENIPCPHGCGKRFEHGKPGNIKRHFTYACVNNPNRITTHTNASGSSSG